MHLRGHANILKRLLMHVSGLKLGLLMRQLTGVGTPRSLQGRACALIGALIDAVSRLLNLVERHWTASWFDPARNDRSVRGYQAVSLTLREGGSATAC